LGGIEPQDTDDPSFDRKGNGNNTVNSLLLRLFLLLGAGVLGGIVDAHRFSFLGFRYAAVCGHDSLGDILLAQS